MKSRQKKITVTGGAGFIGSHLVDALLASGYRVTVIDNLSTGERANLKEASRNKRFYFIKADIKDMSASLKATQNADIVFHLACLGVRHSLNNPLANHKGNTEGTIKVLEACRRNAVKQFFYISTSEIYGDVRSFPVREDAIPRPLTIYGASKLAGEYYTNVYYRCYGLNTAVIRLFNNYGPRAHFEGDRGELIPRSIVSILCNKPPVIFGDGKHTRDFIYVKDTARILLQCIGNKKLKGVTFNIGVGYERRIKDVVACILRLMGRKQIRIVFNAKRPADVPRLWAEVSKFHSLMRARPRYSFEQGLQETVQYYEGLLAQQKDLYQCIPLKNW